MAYPGGFPPQPPQPGPAVRPPLTTAQWLHVGTFALGLITLFLGFAPWASGVIFGVEVSESAYEGGRGLSPALSFVAGTLALLSVLPIGTGRPGPLVPVLALGVTLDSLFTVFAIPDGVDIAAGGILALLFNVFLTAAAAIAYYLDVRRPRLPPGPYPGSSNPTGQFPTSPPGNFPPYPGTWSR